jgi:hypothetical protein
VIHSEISPSCAAAASVLPVNSFVAFNSLVSPNAKVPPYGETEWGFAPIFVNFLHLFSWQISRDVGRLRSTDELAACQKD